MSNETLHIKKMRAFGGLSTSAAVGDTAALSPVGREASARAGVGQSVRAPMPHLDSRRQGGFGEGRGRSERAPGENRAATPARELDRLATAFVDACAKGDEPQAIQVITRGLKVHAFGKELLFAVCENGMSQALEALIARGLKPHGFAGSAFASAMAHSHWTICDRLIEAGFNPRASRGAWADAFKGLGEREQAEAKRRMGPLDFWIGVAGGVQAAKPVRAPNRPRGREWTESELRGLDAQVSPARIESVLWGAGAAQEVRSQEAFCAWAEWEESALARGLSGAALEQALDEAASERLARLASSQKRAQALDDDTLDQLAKLQLNAIASRDPSAAQRSAADQARLDREAHAAAQLIEPDDHRAAGGLEAFLALASRQVFEDKKLAQDHRNAAHHTPGAVNPAATRASAPAAKAGLSQAQIDTLDDDALDQLAAERLRARLGANRRADLSPAEAERIDREAAAAAHSMEPRAQFSRANSGSSPDRGR